MTGLFELKFKGELLVTLSKENARQYRKQINNTPNFEVNAKCPAKILGGWNRSDGIGHFGVKLDITLISQELDEPEDFLLISEFKFLISHPNAQELTYAEIGDYVNFWSPPDDPTKIIIFRQGSAMGRGRLGMVPKKYALLIQKHEALDLPVETEILEVSQSACTIYCRLVQAEEVKKERECVEKMLRAELATPYFPRKPVTVLLRKDIRQLKIGEQYKFAYVPTVDECIESYVVTLIFRSLDGKTTIVKDDDFNIIKKIVRLTNTFDNFDIRVAQKTNVKSWNEFGSRYGMIITPIK
jgi:hypothetical protein